MIETTEHEKDAAENEEQLQKIKRLREEIKKNKELNHRLLKAMTLLQDHLAEDRSEREKSLLIAQLDAPDLPE